MAECKDCLYYEVCPLGLTIKGETGTCLKFENKSDVVKVVRCKDCKRFIPKEKLNPTKYINPLEADGLCVNCDKYTDADDFCSYGVLKERVGK